MEDVDVQINAYIAGDLSETDRIAFEKELQADAQLAARVQAHRDLETRLPKMFANQQQKAEMRAYLASLTSAAPTARNIKPLLIGIAAALVLLAALGYLFLGPCLDKDIVLSEYMRDLNPSYIETSMGADNPLKDLWEQGSARYRREEFSAARELLGQIPESDNFYAKAQLLIGNSHLSEGNWAFSIAALERCRTLSDPAVTADAPWFLALAYIQLDNIPQAEAVLQEIVDNQWFRYPDAKVLKGKIGQFCGE